MKTWDAYIGIILYMKRQRKCMSNPSRLMQQIVIQWEYYMFP